MDDKTIEHETDRFFAMLGVVLVTLQLGVIAMGIAGAVYGL